MSFWSGLSRPTGLLVATQSLVEIDWVYCLVRSTHTSLVGGRTIKGVGLLKVNWGPTVRVLGVTDQPTL